jgi:hypothetical protein
VTHTICYPGAGADRRDTTLQHVVTQPSSLFPANGSLQSASGIRDCIVESQEAIDLHVIRYQKVLTNPIHDARQYKGVVAVAVEEAVQEANKGSFSGHSTIPPVVP